MPGKYDINTTLAEAVNGPQIIDYDITGAENFSLELTYDSATTGEFELQASNSGTAFYPIGDAAQEVDPLGGGVFWNVNNCRYKNLRILIPGGVIAATVEFLGNRLEKKE